MTPDPKEVGGGAGNGAGCVQPPAQPAPEPLILTERALPITLTRDELDDIVKREVEALRTAEPRGPDHSPPGRLFTQTELNRIIGRIKLQTRLTFEKRLRAAIAEATAETAAQLGYAPTIRAAAGAQAAPSHSGVNEESEYE